ncbi:plasmid partitioning protein RepB [Roseobacter cerasinus]|uniref:Plasmid partitioning protein RepB n=1 Tax=Roseobacter cerasinus TaxID=2602289 RepID=A0A640VX39_9RHOB|nr:plasmid partitioning protein RepB [Roseobacter cerasinus]GFE51930.1 plasmid partitioning protein RepB [Roseobacter cerasinus]
MSNNRKKRLSMLDTLAATQAPAPSGSMMATNRALRSARDAVDAHHVWDLDPWCIDDLRPEDRLDAGDVADLRDAIEVNGQTVPILVRRSPDNPDRYLLVYGRRRLEAIRQSDKVDKVRALVATLDDTAAVRAQISENMARRDLSYIEKALFARALIDSGFGTQSHVAEVLTVSKSAISMALAVVDMVSVDLARAIGPAPGVGRPRWDALSRAIETSGVDTAHLIPIAQDAHDKAAVAAVSDPTVLPADPSVAAFEAVAAELDRHQAASPAQKPAKALKSRTIQAGERRIATVRRAGSGGVRLDVDAGNFADWLERNADAVLQELHTRWQTRGEE